MPGSRRALCTYSGARVSTMGAELGDEVNCETRAAAAARAMQPLSGFSTDSSNAGCFSGCDVVKASE